MPSGPWSGPPEGKPGDLIRLASPFMGLGVVTQTSAYILYPSLIGKNRNSLVEKPESDR
jgi:hypothetical protein